MRLFKNGLSKFGIGVVKHTNLKKRPYKQKQGIWLAALMMGGTTVKLPLFRRPHPALMLSHASLPLQTLPVDHPGRSADAGAVICPLPCHLLCSSTQLAPCSTSSTISTTSQSSSGRFCTGMSLRTHSYASLPSQTPPAKPLLGTPSSSQPFPPHRHVCQDKRALSTKHSTMLHHVEKQPLSPGHREKKSPWVYVPTAMGVRTAPHCLVLKPTGTARSQKMRSSFTTGRLWSQDV